MSDNIKIMSTKRKDVNRNGSKYLNVKRRNARRERLKKE